MEAHLKTEGVWTGAFMENMFMGVNPARRYAPGLDGDRNVVLVSYEEVMEIVNAGLPGFDS